MDFNFDVIVVGAGHAGCEAAAASAQDSFTLVQARYENGKANITEFNESRNQLLKTRSDAVQATYEYLFQSRLVNFYRGGELAL
jgi:outer membrane protein